MQKAMSLPPVSLGSPEIDWGFVTPNLSRRITFQTAGDGDELQYKDGKQLEVPKELEGVVAVIDEDFRGLNDISDDSPVTHQLDVRSGFGNFSAMLTSAVLESFGLRPLRHQPPSSFHLDLMGEDEGQFGQSYTMSSSIPTQFMIGDFWIVGGKYLDSVEHPARSYFSAVKTLLGNYALLRAQKGLIVQPDAGELVRFDPATTVHRAPYRHYDGSGLDHGFLRDVVRIQPSFSESSEG